MINQGQIQLIHVAKAQLGLDDDLYREILENLYGVKSCTKLSYAQANNLIEHFKSKGFTPKPKPPRKKVKGVVELPSPAQNELIEVLKANIVWHAGADGFKLWLTRRMRMSKITTKQDAARVIEGLKGMLGIDSEIIQMRALPFPLRLDESYFINSRTGEVLPFRWVYDLSKRKLVKVARVFDEQI